MSHIFICHAEVDDDFASQLAADLRDTGIGTWVDHENMPEDDNAIADAIETGVTFLYLVTHDSLASDMCEEQLSYALDSPTLVVMIMAESSLATTDLPARLQRRQWVDFRGDSYNLAFKNLIISLGMEGKTAMLKPPPDQEND